MTISENFPYSYYINLEKRIERRESLENQFKKWGIKNYQRVNASEYDVKKYDDWKDQVFEGKIIECTSTMSCTINHLRTIIDWYNNNVSETCILMEDDICLDNFEYLNFDWNYFQKNIPENWDCIQLYFCRPDFIPMFLHKRITHTSSIACYMINRSFAEKVKKLLFVDGKYKLTINNNSYNRQLLTADATILEIGITYSVPIFSINLNMNSSDNMDNKFKVSQIDVASTKIINNWWKNEKNNFPLEDFFHYLKPNDSKMIKRIVY